MPGPYSRTEYQLSRVVNFRMSEVLYGEAIDWCETHEVPFSTLVRMAIRRQLDELYYPKKEEEDGIDGKDSGAAEFDRWNPREGRIKANREG